MRTLVQSWKDGRASALEEVDNQAYPGIRTQRTTKSYWMLDTICMKACLQFLPASLTILLFVQCLMIIASGRTLVSISTYVLIILVFSSARVLLTFMSHARHNSGSQIFTIGTLAVETQITFSIPSAVKLAWRIHKM